MFNIRREVVNRSFKLSINYQISSLVEKNLQVDKMSREIDQLINLFN